MRIFSIILVAALILGSTAAGTAWASDVGSATAGPQAGTVTHGTGGSVTFLVTLQRGGQGHSTVSAVMSVTSPLPPGAKATFSPPTVTVGDVAATTTLTIQTVGSTPAGLTGVTVHAEDTRNNKRLSASVTCPVKVEQAPLNVTATASNKVYDGSTAAAVTLSDNREPGDQITVGFASATFADKKAGSAKVVTVSGITVTGPDADDYTFSSTTSTTADITTRPLSVSATGVDKVYEGTTAATVTLSDNRVVGDVLTDNYASATFADKKVGAAKAVSVTGITVTGPDAANYTPNSTASTAANIYVRGLNVRFTGVNKIYDGKILATVTPTDDRVPGDVITVSYASATFADKKVGTAKSISVTGIIVTGPDAINYAYKDAGSAAADITCRTLNVAFTGRSKVYDGTTAAVVTVGDDRVAGDVLTINYASATFVDKKAGTAKPISVTGITITGPDAGNYCSVGPITTQADIFQRSLNVRFTGANKVYDGKTLATVTPSDDRVTGDVITVNYASATFADKKVGTAKAIAVTGITVTGPDAGNYAYKTDSNAAADITLRSLNLAFTGGNKIYDGKTLATVTPGDDRVPGDVLTVTYTSATFADKKVATAKPVTVTGISVTGPDASNYAYKTDATSVADITCRALHIIFTGGNKVYDGKVIAPVTPGDDRIAGDVLTVTFASATFADRKVGSAKPVTITGIAVTGPDASNYCYSTDGTTVVDITPRSLNVRFTGANKVYDGKVLATVTPADDRIAGDVLTIGYASATFADKKVGSAKAVTVTGITVAGPDAGNYAYKTDVTTQADITPRGLTVSFIGGNKIYDGKTGAEVTPLDDRVAGDVLTVAYGSATFANKNVGTAKAVTVTGISVTGPDAGNYAYKTDGTAAANITVRTLNVQFSGGNKVYDGRLLATLTPGDDRVSGDVLTVTYASATFADKNVGTAKPIAVNGITVAGPDAGNYSYSNASTTTANITPRSLNFSFTGGNKTYDGKVLASVTPGDDRVSGDVLTVGYASALFADKNVGSGKAVNVSGIAVTGPDAGNYAYKTETTTSANIIPRNLNLLFTGGNKTYDGKILATVTPTDDRVPGDALTVTYGSALFADKNVGSAKPVNVTGITVTGADAGNYAYKHDATTTADITLRNLNLTFVGGNKVYNGNNGAVVTPTDDRVPGDVLTISYGSATFADKKVGTAKPVSVTGITVRGPDAGNYAYYVSATAAGKRAGANKPVLLTGVTILGPKDTPKGTPITAAGTTADITPRSLTLLFTGANKVYDGKVAATATPGDDRVAGDVITVNYGNAAFADKKVGTAKPVIVSAITVTGPDAGNYAYKTDALTAADIIARGLNLTFTQGNKIYDGKVLATVTPGDDRVAGDVISVAYTGATFADKNVGSAKPVTVTGITVTGVDAGNYAYKHDGSTTADITKRNLTVTFTGGNKVYDGKLLATVTPGDDRLAGDVLTVNHVSALFLDKNVGSAKPVYVSGITVTGPDGNNYTYNNTATSAADITPRALTLLFGQGNKIYDGKLVASVTPSDDRISGDVITVNYASASFADKNVGSAKPVSVTGITVAGPDYGNYAYKIETNTAADIWPRNLTVTFTGGYKVYDGQTGTTVTPTDDRVTGDQLTISYGSATFADKKVGRAKLVSVTGIRVTGTDAGNYAYKDAGSMYADITALNLNILFTGGNKIYDGTTLAVVTPSSSNRVPNDLATVIYGSASFFDKKVGSAKTVTVTGIRVSGPDAGNYVVPDIGTTAADIFPRNLHVAFAGVNKVYNGNTLATVTPSSVDDRIPGDLLTPGYVGATFADKNVGRAKPVTVTGVTVTGPDAGNYAYKDMASTAADITPRPLNVTVAGFSKVYDGTTRVPPGTPSDDHVTGDQVTVNTSAYFLDKNVGKAKPLIVTVTLTGLDAPNYIVNSPVNATGDITCASLVVTASAVDRTYDATNVASATLSDNRIPGDVLTLSYFSASFADKRVGPTKLVTVNGIKIEGGPDAGNYCLANTAASTSATIKTYLLTVTPHGKNKKYDGTIAAEVTHTDDRFGGDVFDIISGGAHFDDPNAGTAKRVTESSVAPVGPDAPNYTVNLITTTTADITVLETTSSLDAPTSTGVTVQYSDQVTFAASLALASVPPGPAPATSVTFSVGTKVIGTANLALQGTAFTGTLTAQLLAAPAPGPQVVTAAFNGINTNFTVANVTAPVVTIVPEDARTNYSGGLFVTTNSSSSGKATINLSAIVKDITATADAAGDGWPGDIRNATVTFIDRGNGGTIIGTTAVGLLSSADPRIGSATVNWPVDIGSADTKTFTVGIVIGNYYTRNSSDDITLVTVAKACDRLVAGGGTLALVNSAGIAASAPGATNNFGFGVRYDSDDNPKGNFNTIVRSGGRVYQIQGSSLSSFAVKTTSSGGTSSFKGKGSIVDITDPLAQTSVEPSATVQVSLSDLGEPGSSDLLALTVSTKSGALWFSSNWDGSKTVQQTLSAGNIVVRGSRSSSAPTAARLANPTGSVIPSSGAIPVAYAFPQNYPNPFRESTNLRFELPERSRVTVMIYDVSGREVANLVDGEVEAGFHVTSWSGRNQEGQSLGAGVYFVRMNAKSVVGTGGLRADRRIVLVK